MPVAESVALAMLRTWRRVRTDVDSGGLNYPTVNILHPRAGLGAPFEPLQRLADAERVQAIVNDMPANIRRAFEAYYLGLVGGERCRDSRQKARAVLLRISEGTYFRRVAAGRLIVREQLEF